MKESFGENIEHPEKEQKSLSKEFFDLQLAFAKSVSEKTGDPLSKVIFTHTTFYRRFGFGAPTDADELNPEWQEYANGLEGKDENDLLDYTYNFYQHSQEEKLSPPEFVFGWFRFDPINKEDGVVYLHFYNHHNDKRPPLSQDKIETRKQELTEMFRYIKQTYPYAKSVKSGSWIQGVEAYRRLLPSTYNDSQKLISPNSRFQGVSRWGQFLKSNGQVRENLKTQFLENLKTLDVEHAEEAFPMPTYQTEAPIQAFYDFYGIDNDPVTED